MKTLKIQKSKDILVEFALSNEEMINVRGGDSAEVTLTFPKPPVKI
ncbi:MAG: hypothetical protein MUO72_17965 [Bacteroidales bacterium]|nr:hypothetical protein [Bacteroidales bacterium]